MMDLLRQNRDYVGAVGLAFLAAGGVRWIINQRVDQVVIATAVIGVILLIIALLSDPAALRGLVTGRRTLYSTNVVVSAVAFLAILGLINFLGTRYTKRIDLTEEKNFSLSAQTLQILQYLDKPVHIIAFYNEGAGQELRDRLTEYTRHTSKVTFEFIDPDARPAEARRYNITSYGTLLFECEGRQQTTYGSDEQEITSNILKVSRTEQKVIYFLTGHGERDINDGSQTGFSEAKRLLEMESYKVLSANLVTTPTVPANAAVLVIASPVKELLEQERQAIWTYLKDGGKLLWLTDPGIHNTLEDEALTKYGLRFDNNLIIDPASSLLGDVATPLVNRFEWSQVTKDLRVAVFFPSARSISTEKESPQGVVVTAIARSSEDSWGETDLANRQVRFDEGKDLRGPLNIGLIVEITATGASVTQQKSRLAIFGDSDFASNGGINTPLGNRDLLVNTVNWLAEEESLISIRPKPPTDRSIFLTGNQGNMIFLVTTILMPLAVLLVGGLVWWRRR